jgi:hypothetical protein
LSLLNVHPILNPLKRSLIQMASPTQASSGHRVTKFFLSDDTETPVPFLVLGAGLALAIAIIHLQDQVGLLGNQSPLWLKYGYYLVEISSTISAALIIRGKTGGWLLGLASSIGPMTGYIMSRTAGVPGDPGDIGNWGYLLGTVSLIVEGSFIVLAVICLVRIRRAELRNPRIGARRSVASMGQRLIPTEISALPSVDHATAMSDASRVLLHKSQTTGRGHGL